MENPKTNRSTFTLPDLLIHLTRGWKLLVTGIIVGGLLGWFATSFIKPVYESTAIFSFVIDFARTGLLTDIEEDQALEIAGDLIKSTQVSRLIQKQASAHGIDIDDVYVQENFTAERRFNQWLLKVHSDDPHKATELANLWSQVSLAEFQKASMAAIKADGLNRYILSLETCYQQSTSGLAGQPLCRASDRNQLQAEIEKTGTDLQYWLQESRGIFAGLNFSLVQEAASPESPSQHSRGALVLAGALTGMLAVSLYLLFTYKI